MMAQVQTPLPTSARDLALFLSQGIQVDRRRRHAGVAKPALHEVERHAGSNRMNPETVPKPLRSHVRTFRNGYVAQHGHHQLPIAKAVKSPKWVVAFFQDVCLGQGIEQLDRHRHLADHGRALAFLQRTDRDEASLALDRLRDEREGLGNSAPCVEKDQAEDTQVGPGRGKGPQRGTGCARAFPFN
jgi:hypothetical protein